MRTWSDEQSFAVVSSRQQVRHSHDVDVFITRDLISSWDYCCGCSASKRRMWIEYPTRSTSVSFLNRHEAVPSPPDPSS